VGTGGMITKLEAAKIALAAGCHMIIAKGKKLHALGEIDKSPRTCFVASSNPHNARKSWISGAILAGGSITIDDGALQAVKKGKSLLPAGVKTIEGFFERGDAVNIKDTSGNIVGKGLIAYSAEDSTKIIGNNSSEIEAILGFKGRTAIMHRDDLVLKDI
ncbi:MAG: PUA domain-containing protein, partial [Pseudomonadota bacterium]